VAWLATARVGAIAVPISTFSTPIELRDLLARADVDLLIGVPAYRGNDYVAGLHDALGEDVVRVPSPTVPFLRHVWLERGSARRGARRPGWRAECSRRGGLTRDRTVIVILGFDHARRRAAPARVAPRPPRRNRLRPRPGGAPVLNSACSGSVGSPQHRQRARRRRHPCARPRSTRPRRSASSRLTTRQVRARRSPRWSRASFPARLLVDPGGNLTRCPAIRPADPGSGTTCSARPRPAASCHMDPDETDQPETQAARSAGAQARPGWSTPTASNHRAGVVGEALVRGPPDGGHH
jgi:hypothetical protein